MGDERRPSSRERPRSREQQQALPLDPAAVVEAENITVPFIPGRLGEYYDVSKAVGKGGYAIVYKATRKGDGKIVAIKRVDIFEMSPKKRERCLQEVELLKQLTHPNVIQMLDAFIDENQLIIVFEWAPAGDLKRLIKRCAELGKALEESAVWEYFFQITDALRYMHANRIMHRDIKPANVLVGAGGALKLGDLGLGRQFSEHTLEAFSKVGTPYYVSPEVVKGAGYDWKSDVWSLGCLLYELAALRSPFEMEGANLYDVFQKISRGNFTPLPADQWSEPLRRLVARMLQNDPAARPELEEVWSATREVLQVQSQSKENPHVLSERAHRALLLLAADARLAAAHSRRSPLAPAPLPALAALHPLFFAIPLSRTLFPTPVPLLTTAHRLGILLQLLAWLVRACGKSETARDLLSHLEAAAPAEPQRPPQRPGAAPMLVCSSSPLQAAEAMRAAAVALRIEVEGAPASQLAGGHGRAVAWLVEQMALVTLQQLGIGCLLPQRGGPELMAEEAEEEGTGLGDDCSALLQAAPTGQTAHGDAVEDEDAAYYGAATSAAQPPSTARPGPQPPTTSSAKPSGATAPPPPRVDAVAWRVELERLQPRLSAIRLKAGSHDASWIHRWTLLKDSGCRLATASQPTLRALRAIQQQVANDLERVAAKESHLTGNTRNTLGLLSNARLRVTEVQAGVQQRQEEITAGAAALQQMVARLKDAQVLIHDLAEGLDGTRQVRAIKDAIAQVQGEVRRMDVRLGLAVQQLLRRRRRPVQGISFTAFFHQCHGSSNCSNS